MLDQCQAIRRLGSEEVPSAYDAQRKLIRHSAGKLGDGLEAGAMGGCDQAGLVRFDLVDGARYFVIIRRRKMESAEDGKDLIHAADLPRIVDCVHYARVSTTSQDNQPLVLGVDDEGLIVIQVVAFELVAVAASPVRGCARFLKASAWDRTCGPAARAERIGTL